MIFCGTGLGDDRSVRSDVPFPPLLSAPWCVYRLRGGEGARGGARGQAHGGGLSLSHTQYFEIVISPPAEDAARDDSCVAVGLGMKRFPLKYDARIALFQPVICFDTLFYT